LPVIQWAMSPIHSRAAASTTASLSRGAIAATLRAVTKLQGNVDLVASGDLPNDGKIIADERG